MKRILFLAWVIAGITFTSCAQQGSENANQQEQTTTFSNVSVDDLQKVVNNKEVTIVDARTPEEYADGYIANAKNINIKSDGFESEATGLDKSKTIYVYCRSGYRSQLASEKLISMGFTDVRNVEGGISAWQGKGYEVVK